MKDSILKGTGNSRFLKSAVPAGTSWADALAMLQAGTFPIDFNGINAEGFQQVGTPLNKANLLKDATAAQIGLPPSTTPDGMFQALGNTGELHVWRKTVTTAQEIPAGYTLGSTEENVLIASRETSYMAGALYYYYGNSITVSDNGNASNPASDSYEMIGRGYATAKTILSGPMFVKCATDYISSSTGQQTAMPTKEGLSLFFIPSGGNLVVTVSDYPGNSSIKVVSVVATKYQLVNAYPLTPAGTTTTYPVSTNPNAYQEGNDAKPAGYTLGNVVTGAFRFATNSNHSVWYHVSDSLNVADDGAISLGAYKRESMRGGMDYNSSTIAGLKGKFIQLESNDYAEYVDSPFSNLGIYYVPSDAVFSGGPATDRYQPVTGYAAIPAGTTIEYLGKLGDKARVQVVSYVGTGTYGENNPCSLTFDFAPMVVVLLGIVDPNGKLRSIHEWDVNYIDIRIPSVTPTTFTAYYGFGQTTYVAYQFGRVSTDRKTFYWYGSKSAFSQLNESGYVYYYLGIG